MANKRSGGHIIQMQTSKQAKEFEGRMRAEFQNSHLRCGFTFAVSKFFYRIEHVELFFFTNRRSTFPGCLAHSKDSITSS